MSWSNWEARLRGLTSREREVFILTTMNYTAKEIGERLGGISPRTVEHHRTHISRKLGLTALTEWVALGIKAGLRPQDPQSREEIGKRP